MSIVNTLPVIIKNGDTEDATVVMSLFAFIQSQVNTNACPATVGSSILKGNGAGGTTNAVAGTDYTTPTGLAPSTSLVLKGSGTGGIVAAVVNTDYLAPGDSTGVTSINGGQLAGMRNRIINGACDIAQRPSAVMSSGTATYGGPDRFNSENTASAGGQFTQSQASMTYGGLVKNTIRQTVNSPITSLSAGTYWYGINQYLEGSNCFDLKGQPVAVSFIFNTNLAGTYSVSVRDGSSTYSYVSTFTVVANTPTKVVILASAIPLAAAIPNSNARGMSVTIGFLNQGTYQTSSLNVWQVNNVLAASTATNWGATAGNFIELTDLQLEIGTVATTFERRNYSVEKFLCEWYYRNLSPDSCSVVAATNSTIIISPVNMRVAPTVTHNLTNGTYSNALNPTGLLWVFYTSSNAYTFVSAGSFTFAVKTTSKLVSLFCETATLSNTPNSVVFGASVSITANAEL